MQNNPEATAMAQNATEHAQETQAMEFDTTGYAALQGAMGTLKKFQEPNRFQKAQFNLKLYKRAADFH